MGPKGRGITDINTFAVNTLAFPLALMHFYFSKTEKEGENLPRNCCIASLPKQNNGTHSL